MFPLSRAIVSVDDAALTFTIDLPPNAAKYTEFQFRCADASELLKWYAALVAATQPGSVVHQAAEIDEEDLAFRTSLVGLSSSECASLGFDGAELTSRSLPAKLDVRFCVLLCACPSNAHITPGVCLSPPPP